MTATPGGTVRVGLLGLGFMGRAHLQAWTLAADEGLPCRVTAVCDRDPERRAGRTGSGGHLATHETVFDPKRVNVHAEAAALFADPDVDLVSITTPTDTHVDLALAAARAGKHVLLEKPVSLRADEVARLAEAVRVTGRLVMPALCIRFWPGWSWLIDTAADGSLGALRSLALRRLSPRPDWNDAFYADPERSGGALFDLHLHDADFVRAVVGDPDAVTVTGDRDHLTACYRFADGPAHVTAEGGWDHGAGFPFQMGFTAVFEGGTAEYAVGREAPLMLARGGAWEPVPVGPLSGYDVECRALLDAVVRGEPRPPVTLGQAWATTRLLEAEARSLQTGEWVPLGPAR